MRRLLLLCAVSLALPCFALAGPAMRGVVKTLTMRDGTTVEATLLGDENLHYYKTADGRCIQKVDGFYDYVDADSLAGVWSMKLQSRNEARRSSASAMPQGGGYIGSRRGLVILVSFADLPFSTEQTEWDDFFNKEGYSTAGMYGSVHDYFYEQSYGKFDLVFDVVGPVTVSNSYSYYGKGGDTNTPYMVKEACQLVDSQVNFGDYDWDGDGYVDQVYVVYAGYNEAQGADEDVIWSHTWALSAIPATRGLRLDGVVIDTYACSSEFHGNGVTNTGVIDGVGAACHEFTHCLGLPDFYDTGSGTNYGMDVWSLLDYGNWVAAGYVPAALTAYERWFSGWLELTELDSPTHVSDMPCITDEPCAYVVYNDANENECYILQNVQRKGFNSAANGHGLLIIHVDYNYYAWFNNTVNNVGSHQRMTIFAADNKYGQYGENASGDPFPGTSNATAFTNETTPASTLYNANTDNTYFMGKPIENITESNGLISFDFMGGTDGMSAPVAYTGRAESEAIHDLTGRLVTKPEHGLYIKKGKKFLVK